MYKFSLKIDDEAHSLTKEEGISFDKIGELLQTLYEAIDPGSNIRCTLGEIRGNCYALDFFTEEEKYVSNFVVVHKNIADIPFKDLSEGQKEYASTLRKVLGNKYYIKAYDADNQEVAKITDIGAKEATKLDKYYTLKTVYGIVSKIGSNTLASNNKHIRIDGIPYDIKVSKDQDIELKEYYGTHKLRIKIRQKRSAGKGRVIDAELISFLSVGTESIIDNLRKEGYVDFSLIKNTHTIADLVTKIYGQ